MQALFLLDVMSSGFAPEIPGLRKAWLDDTPRTVKVNAGWVLLLEKK